MKFALLDGNRTEAFKGARGICPSCNSDLIAKCGEVKMNHWAHKGIRNCDPWWEPETEWHRSWKNNFPVEWQEFIFFDEQTGEKHIADIHTKDKFTIEFQHSHINPNERIAREKFYKNMFWVVDCTRLKRDFPRFLKGRNDFREIEMQSIFFAETLFLDECFPSAWLESSVPVIFDFLGIETLNNLKDVRNPLYCLFPIQIGWDSVVAEISRSAFINSINNGAWLLRTNNFMEVLRQKEKERKKKKADEERERANTNYASFMRSMLFKKRRRWF